MSHSGAGPAGLVRSRGGTGIMGAEDEAEREAVESALQDAGWVYVSWDAHNKAWQFQRNDGSRRLIMTATLTEAMRILLKQLAARDDREA